MKKFLKAILTLLLLVNGITALIGGCSLILHPDGSSLGLSVSFLANSPFSDYSVPGLVLFSLIGILSLVTAVSIHILHRTYAWLLLSEGMILIVWLTIQLIFVPPVYFLHIPIAMTSAFFIYEGIYLIKNESI